MVMPILFAVQEIKIGIAVATASLAKLKVIYIRTYGIHGK